VRYQDPKKPWEDKVEKFKDETKAIARMRKLIAQKVQDVTIMSYQA
jgi:hypothetical protein